MVQYKVIEILRRLRMTLIFSLRMMKMRVMIIKKTGMIKVIKQGKPHPMELLKLINCSVECRNPNKLLIKKLQILKRI